MMRGVADSTYQWCGESATPRISDAGSWWHPLSLIHGVGNSPCRWWRGVVFRIRISPRIRSQNLNGSKGSVRDSRGTNFCKNSENPSYCHVLLSVREIARSILWGLHFTFYYKPTLYILFWKENHWIWTIENGPRKRMLLETVPHSHVSRKTDPFSWELKGRVSRGL